MMMQPITKIPLALLTFVMMTGAASAQQRTFYDTHGVPSAERFGHGKVDRYSDVIRAMQEDAAALVDWQLHIPPQFG